jgi:NADPH-ferrihemoprotein reductase
VQGTPYAVFGLGNRQYEHFNAMGRFVFKHLTTLGGSPILPLGLGDDDADITDDFEVWCEALFTAIDTKGLLQSAALPGVEATPNKQGYIAELEPENSHKATNGATRPTLPWVPESEKHEAQLARVECVRELHSKTSERSCKHVELDLAGEFPLSSQAFDPLFGAKLQAKWGLTV